MQGTGCRVADPWTRPGVHGGSTGAGAFGVESSECRLQDSSFRIENSGFRVQGSGFRVLGTSCRVAHLGTRPGVHGGSTWGLALPQTESSTYCLLLRIQTLKSTIS